MTPDPITEQLTDIDNTLGLLTHAAELHSVTIKRHDAKLKQIHADMATMVKMNKETLDYFEETNKRIDVLETITRDIQQKLTALESKP